MERLKLIKPELLKMLEKETGIKKNFINELDIFENDDEPYNTVLCTSTLLEGINTSTENIIITKPARGYGRNFSNDFEAFDFFNLVGRSGRLFKANLGKAYYMF